MKISRRLIELLNREEASVFMSQTLMYGKLLNNE